MLRCSTDRVTSATGENPINYIVRHMNLDPGGSELTTTCRDGTRIWIITEADRSVTTILLPEEY